MKLRHGRKFCSNAGSCWRLIFVYALMPWLQRYRIYDAVQHVDEDGNVILDETQISQQIRELNLELSGGRETSFAVAPRLLQSAGAAPMTRKKIKDETILRLRRENEEMKNTIAQLKVQLGKLQPAPSSLSSSSSSSKKPLSPSKDYDCWKSRVEETKRLRSYWKVVFI